MKIIVCVKQVPEIADADLLLNENLTDIKNEDLIYGLNEWDSYALEEAVRIKEKLGGTLTVITIADEDASDVLRRSLAMGADEAIHIDNEDFAGGDSTSIATGLYYSICDREYDIILTGAQSSDNGSGQVGPLLAQRLGIPYGALVVSIEIDNDGVIIYRELESNTLEKSRVVLPALFTVQTGINEPRYISIMGIRKVRHLEIEELDCEELGLEKEEIDYSSSCITGVELEYPEKCDVAEILEGTVDVICDKMSEIIKMSGGIK